MLCISHICSWTGLGSWGPVLDPKAVRAARPKGRPSKKPAAPAAAAAASCKKRPAAAAAAAPAAAAASLQPSRAEPEPPSAGVDPGLRARVYSKAYRRAEASAKLQKLTPEAVKETARLAGRKACEDMGA